MDSFPLTPNGKLDRRSLPAPRDGDFARQEYEAPQGEVEKALASIWSDLLSLERVSRHDNFFALGGHSLLAVQMISRLHRLGHSMAVRTLFESPILSVLAQSIDQHINVVVPPNLITPGTTRITPEMLPLIDLDQSDIDRIIGHVPGGTSNIQDIYALSPLQDGILFHHLMAENGDPYVLYTTMAFDSKKLLDRYLAAVQQVVDRHDILRTSFVWQNLSTPAQVVWCHAPLSVTEVQLDPTAGPVATQLKQVCDPRNNRMDLTQAPLLRFVITQESSGRWILAELLHHLTGDHSTLETRQMEVLAIFEGKGPTLAPSQPYRNLIAQARLGVSGEEHERFFKEMLSDIDTPSLPFGLAEVHGDGNQVAEADTMLSQDQNTRIRSQAKRLGVSVATLCHVAWAQVIAQTSGQQHVVFGTVLFGRMQSSTSSEGAMGLFINTLPMRVDLNEDSVEDSVRATHERLASLLEHENASLAVAQRCSAIAAGVPLFSALLNYRHNTPTSHDDVGVYGMEFLECEERTNYPFCISVDDCGTALGLTAQVVHPFDPKRVCGYMQEALYSLCSALEFTPSVPVAGLEVLPAEERQMLLRDWNWTQEDCSEHFCLHHLFEQQVERTPEAIALVHGDKSMTYAELNICANRLAHRLIALGIVPDGLVAICVERSPAMIIAILATLKAGGAYVPLDPTYPCDRLFVILSESSPTILMTDRAGRDALGEQCLSGFITLDPNVTLNETTVANPQVLGLSPRNLVYVIYTSGSTGNPKGVMVEHRMIVRAFDDTAAWFDFNECDTWSMFHSFAFDVSVWEMWGALLYGGKLVLIPHHISRSPQDLYCLLCEHGVTVLNQTPSAFNLLIDYQEHAEVIDSLRYVILAGEALMPASLQPWYSKYSEPKPQIVNMYGPTETFYATYRPMNREDCSLEYSPIGVRFPGLKFYILDRNSQPVPLGATGELYIGGAGVARGYRNRADLTADRFLSDTFAQSAVGRMYRTGDLVRYLPDGNLIFIGRSDDQVKIHGYRIELGEIEARLAEHPSIREAVVVTFGTGNNKTLVAYVLAKPDNQLSLELRSFLVAKLPEYMIPAAFVCMDVFPLTPNGKLDRRSLPAPGDGDFARQEYEAPQGEVEKALASIWSDLLSLERVSRRDSFFALGGHSLLAVRLMNRVAKLGVNIPVSSLFASPCLSTFAAVITEHLAQGQTMLPKIVPTSRDNLLSISFSQQRLWFLAQLEGVSNTYHIPLAIRLHGDFNKTACKQALDEMYARHESLRTTFVNVEGQPQSRILEAEGVPLRCYDLRGSADRNERMKYLADEETRGTFDLARGPLIRAAIIQLSDEEHVLQSFKGDHIPIVLDGELSSALKQLSQKHGVTLFMTILAAWSAVLSRLSGQDDVIIGTPSANRSRQEIEPLIGFFVNTLAMRVDMSGEPNTKELLERVRRITLGAYAHQDLPFEQVVEIVQPPRRMSHTPLFQVMFAWQNIEEGEWDLPGLQVSPFELNHDTTKFDLTLSLCESGDGIAGCLDYATSLFDKTTIERHVGYLRTLLQMMVSDVDQSLKASDILSPAERTLLLKTWNDTREEYPEHLCLHHLFEQQVERTPEAIALVHGDQSMTYAELNVCANRLAHRLIELGIVPDGLVAICVERSPATIIAILATLKAGGAYVPLDPVYASERLVDILYDATPVCVIADITGRIAIGEASLSSLMVLDPNVESTHPISDPLIPGLTSRHLAYVIYTSGTTGKPKGVMVEHQGVVSLVLCRQDYLCVQVSSRMTQYYSVGFDPSVLEIFGSLGFGGRLYLLTEDTRRNPRQLWTHLKQYHITHAMVTPSALQQCDDPPPLDRLLALIVGGESLSTTLLQKLRNLVPNGSIFNEFGPTETSVVATSYYCSSEDPQDMVPIGRPIANRTVYLLDRHYSPVPLGSMGEIYIGGVGVARGYMNMPNISNERFIADPFSTATNARMYKTGDMAKYLLDGNLVYIGRRDYQVKIRGFRIELGEVEMRLSEHPMVSEVAVVALGDDINKRLVAYVVVRPDDQLEPSVSGANGGHSLMAVRLISRIRSMLAFDMSLRTLFEAPTIAELAPRLLATGATQTESFDVLLPIKPKGSKPPLFCVHPAFGLSWCYTGLSTRLDPDQPLYGLQARGFIGDEKMASTLDEMVLDYIGQVRRIQPRGPYHLLGYSFGGWVAHAMASYLEKHGEYVTFVALMDTQADYHSRGRHPPAEEKDENVLEGLVAVLVGNKEQYPMDLINPFLEKSPMITRNSVRIGSAQEPGVIKSDLIVFRATVLPKGVEKLWSPDDWRPYVLGKIEVYNIDCEHNYMDLPEPTAIIGRVLSQKLSTFQKEE
ncbi:hypothetical protein EC968_007867 [Mortierella alpina]|nr:hypothetical protein EC968_007867 [Mortierella alpina]